MVQSQGHGGGSLLGRILSCSVMTQSVASSSTVQYEPDGFEVQLQNDTGLVITYKGSTGTSWLNTPLEDGGTIDTGTSVTFGMKYPGCMDWNHGGFLDFEFREDGSGDQWQSKRSFYILLELGRSLVFGNIKIFAADAGLAFKETGQLSLDNRNDERMFLHGIYGTRHLIPEVDPRQLRIAIGKGDVPVPGFIAADQDRTKWMTELIHHYGEQIADLPLSYLRISGTHNSCTYKSLSNTNWKCQDHDLYQQLKMGLRYFDVRLKRSLLPMYTNAGKVFWPHHGPALYLGDQLAVSPTEIGGMDTLLGQALQFYNDTDGSSEFFILSFLLESVLGVPSEEEKCLFWQTVRFALDGKCMPSPGPHGVPKKLPELRKSPERIILAFREKERNRPSDPNDKSLSSWFDQYVWGPHEGFTPGRYDGAIWQKMEPQLVVEALTQFMSDPRNDTISRRAFWNAPCQLTPGGFARGLFITPVDLAKRMNPYVMRHALGQKIWLENANILTCDFPDGAWINRVLWMNYNAEH